MRELHGVVFAGHPTLELKRRALLFDKFHLWDFVDEQPERTSEFRADIAFLRSNHIVVDAPPIIASEFAKTFLPEPMDVKRLHAQLEHAHASRNNNPDDMVQGTLAVVRDGVNRMLTARVIDAGHFDVVPICELELPHMLLGDAEHHLMGDVLTVTLRGLPAPDESCSWEDIISFKAELADKH
jgi:hypothetical protein